MSTCRYSLLFPALAFPTHQQLHDVVQPIIDGYIWHRQPFLLRHIRAAAASAENEEENVEIEGDKGEWMEWKGESDVGDCVDDEWFIVGILFQLSRAFPQSLITCTDDDGQFLLIEAALHLPRWVVALDESSMDGRVFICNGKLHIVAPPSIPSSTPRHYSKDRPPLTPQTGLRLSKATEASEKIQKCLKVAIDRSANQNRRLHYATLIVPRSIARILTLHNPNANANDHRLIPLAVDAYLYRDPAENKLLASMRCIKDADDPVAVVGVPFTRHQFAALRSVRSQYPPRPFMRSQTISRIVANPVQLQKEFSWLDIGVKIACGFEILLNKNSDLSKEGVGETGDVVVVDGGFQGCVDFKLACQQALEESRMKYADDQEFERALEAFNSRRQSEVACDDDSWLYVQVEDIDKLMEERMGRKSHVVNDLSVVSERLTDFGRGQADFNGVASSDESISSDDDSESDLGESDLEDAYFEDGEGEDLEMRQFMETFDEELLQMGIKGSELEELQMVKNLVQSFASQQGGAGPAQTLLNSLGVSLPTANDDSASETDVEDDEDESDCQGN